MADGPGTVSRRKITRRTQPSFGGHPRFDAAVGVVAAAVVLIAFAGIAFAALRHSNTALVSVHQTDQKLGQRMARLKPIALQHRRSGAATAATATASETIRIEPGKTGQTFWGVGAAVTDSSASLIHGLPAAEQTKLLERLYGRSGLGLSFGTIPIGSSDYSATGEPYTYDDLPAGETDPGLAYFSVTHDEAYILPVLKQISEIQTRIKFFATTWTAPSWMKANDRFNDLGFAGSLLPQYYGTFAEYLVNWLRAYQAYGVKIAALAPENEPNSPAGIPAMDMPLPVQETFIEDDLAPALRASGLSTQIFGGDVGMPRLSAQEELADSSAGQSLGGLAWHCYGDAPTQLAAAASADPKLTEIVTECAQKISKVPLAQDMLGALANDASGFSAWNLALTPDGGPVQLPNRACAGCRGLVTIEPSDDRYELSYQAYVLGQVGHFVKPGAVRLQTTDEPSYYTNGIDLKPNSGTLNVAFANPDGTIVVVTYNQSKHAKTVDISDGAEHFSARLPAGATTTFSFRPPHVK